jgi:hypothetical protein
MNVILNASQDEAQVVELSPKEGREFFDREAQRLLGISGQEFVSRYEAGELGADDSSVLQLAMLLPFWQAAPQTRLSPSS